MKKTFYILLTIIIISIAVIIFLKISNFHFAKIGYVMHSKNIENSKAKKVFIEELKPSKNQISNHQITIEEVFAENPWFYTDYFRTIDSKKDNVTIILKLDSILNRDDITKINTNNEILDLYTDYTGERKYVTYIYKGIAFHLPDSIYNKLDSIELKFPNPQENLILHKIK